MVRDESTCAQDRTARKIGAPAPRDGAASVSLPPSARQQWVDTARRLTPGLWVMVLSEGFSPPEAAAVCRLAWLSLAQDWDPQNTSDDDILMLFRATIDRQRRFAAARAVRGTSGVTPGGSPLLVAL